MLCLSLIHIFLRPKPPKAGRRILLERVGFLWRRFSFNTKMIVRNLMRNRMRTIMSLSLIHI